MPLYEYRCEPCDHVFEALVRDAADVVRCPKCDDAKVVKQFSVPAPSPTGTLGYLPVASSACCRGESDAGGCGCAMN